MGHVLPEELSEVVRHLESAYPREGCGVLLRAGEEGPWRFRPLRNAHEAPRLAYAFDPREWLAVLLEAESRGEHVACVVHSHVDCGADFSDEDRRQAAPEGHPLLPGVFYLVMAVHAGGVRDTRIFRWECGEFREFPFSQGL
ncbi:M67 family metallopeptidase [Archangium minus]|uniref:M67 family metallopeptidase n=1 Tax=Archangium minus TaxID=83450 RepID=A0ABY9WXR3_9BACT|nr:M67 family metallopeptidase [Archangium minus]